MTCLAQNIYLTSDPLIGIISVSIITCGFCLLFCGFVLFISSVCVPGGGTAGPDSENNPAWKMSGLIGGRFQSSHLYNDFGITLLQSK